MWLKYSDCNLAASPPAVGDVFILGVVKDFLTQLNWKPSHTGINVELEEAVYAEVASWNLCPNIKRKVERVISPSVRIAEVCKFPLISHKITC